MRSIARISKSLGESGGTEFSGISRLSSGAGWFILVGTLLGVQSLKAAQTISYSPNQSRPENIQITAALNPTTLNALGLTATHTGVFSQASGVVGTITKIGPGTLILSGANSYTGPTVINAGALSISSLTSAPSTSGIGSSGNAATNLVLNGGGLIYTGTGTGTTMNRLFSVGLLGGTLTGSGSGALNFNATGTMGFNDQTGARNLTLNGNHTGSILSLSIGDNGGATSLTKSGSGTWSLRGVSTYTGTTEITGGTLRLALPDIIGNSSAMVIGSDGIFDMNNKAETLASLSGSGSIISMGLLSVGGDNGSTSFSGTMANDGALTKTGTGVLSLSGSSTYTGVTTISGGTLSVTTLAAGSAPSSIGQSTATAGNLILNGGILQYTGAAVSTDRLFTLGTNGGTLDASGTGAVNFSAAGSVGLGDTGNARTLTLAGSNGGANTLEAVIADASGSGPTSLVKSGVGRWVLGGQNTFTGNTTISGGTLALSSAGSLSTSPVLTVGSSGSTDAVLDVTAKTSFRIGSGQTLAGVGTVKIGAGKTVTIDGHLAPGNSIGTNAVTGNLELGSGSTSDFQLGAPGTHASPGSSDRTAVSGSLTLGGTLNVINDANASGLGSAGAGSYQIFTQAGTASGSFAAVNALGSGASVLHPVVNTSTAGSVYLDVYRLASGASIPTSQFLGNVRSSEGTLSGSLNVSNTAAADGFSENLGVDVHNNGSIDAVAAPGESAAVHFSLPTNGTAGPKTGSTSVAVSSMGAGTFGATLLGTGSISLSGNVYDYATPAVVTTSPVAFGTVHQGALATGTVSISNQTISNAAYQDSLDASATSTHPRVTGTNAHIQAGTSGTMTLTADTSAAGSLASTVSLGFISNANGVAGLSNTPLTGASISTTGLVYSGLATWSTNGNGSWGELAGSGEKTFGANWGSNQGSPGLDAAFTNTDTATFDNTALSPGSSAVVSLNGANPSLHAITFDTAGGGYTLAQGSGGAITLNGGTGSALITVGQGAHTISAPLIGAGGLTKAGAGTLTLSGINTYTGSTTILDGRLILNGTTSGDVAVQAGAEFTGRATVGGTLGGAGAIGPGNSPGILTAGSVNPTGGISFNFEFTLAGLAAWADASDSGNDVLHLSLGFTSPLTSTNVVNLYFAEAGVAYTGGFFLDGATDELSADLANGTFRYFVLDEATGTILYNGHHYKAATTAVSMATTKITGANFSEGSVDGWTQTFQVQTQVVPEPGTWALLIGGVVVLVGLQRRRLKLMQVDRSSA